MCTDSRQADKKNESESLESERVADCKDIVRIAKRREYSQPGAGHQSVVGLRCVVVHTAPIPGYLFFV